MSYYSKHLFFCTNQRASGESCCNNSRASEMRDYAKQKVKMLGISTAEQTIRINSAGCLGRCDNGPVLVVYPEAVWYTYVDESDIDEIIEEHLINGRIINRLQVA